MIKSIYCIYWRWFDANGNELERRCSTHAWFSSYRKARAEYEKQKLVLYGNYPDRRLENDSPKMGWSNDDGTYELEAVKIYAHIGEQDHVRLVLAATNLY